MQTFSCRQRVNFCAEIVVGMQSPQGRIPIRVRQTPSACDPHVQRKVFIAVMCVCNPDHLSIGINR
jgi:hypothetical protein